MSRATSLRSPALVILPVLVVLMLLAAMLPARAQSGMPPDMRRYVLGVVRCDSTERSAVSEHAHAGAWSTHQRTLLEHAEDTRLMASGVVDGAPGIHAVLLFLDDSVAAVREAISALPLATDATFRVDLHPWWASKDIERSCTYRAGSGSATMETLALGFLLRGSSWSPEATPEVMEIQKRHMAHIGMMAESGELVAAGPFGDGGSLRGIFVFRCPLPRARELAHADPAVQAGRLRLDLMAWTLPTGVIPVPKTVR